MDLPTIPLLVATNLLGGGGMLAVSLAAYRRRSDPGMRSFALVAGIFGALALALLSLFAAFVLGAPVWIVDVVFGGLTAAAMTASVPWVAFVLQYTGHSEFLTRRRLVAMAVPALTYVALVVALIVRAQSGSGSSEWNEEAVGLLDVALWNGVFLLVIYLVALFLVGAVVLVRSTYAYSHMSSRMGALLAAPSLVIGVLVPSLWQITINAGREVAGTAFGSVLVLGVVCYGVVLYRDDDFGSTSAAAAPVGRRATLEEFSAAVFTIDDEHRVVDVNDAAQETFGLSETGPLGEPVGEVLGIDADHLTSEAQVGVDDAGDLRTASTVFLETVYGRRRFHVETVDLTDEAGRRLGLAVSLEDITDRALREQRISILNRVLRHNLRNKLSIVRGHAEMIPGADGDADSYADAIEDAATDLLALGERARDVERLLSVDADTVADAGAVAEAVVERRDATCEEVRYKLDLAESVNVSTPREALEFVLDELCENAGKHNDAKDPRVTVRCDRDGDWARIQVIDNGPTLDDQELVAVDAQGESPLEHGSGLGLWSVRWIVTAFGGHLDVEENEPRGSVVQVLLPIEDEAVPGGPADEALLPDRDAAAAER